MNDKQITETGYAADEKGASSTSITGLFAELNRPVYSITEPLVSRGVPVVSDRIGEILNMSDRPPIIVCDASKDCHLGTIANAAVEHDPLYVGSGGLANHVVVPADPLGEPAPVSIKRGVPLGVVGSISELDLARL